MQHLRYTAPKQVSEKKKYKLFSYVQLLAFFIICIAVLIYLFPGNSLQNALLSESDISNTDLYYSMSLLKRNANEAELYNLMVKNKSQAIVYLDNQRVKLAGQHQFNPLWLNYIVLRSIYFSPLSDSNLKQQAIPIMMNFMMTFKEETPSENENKILAKDALAMNQTPLALFFFERVVQANPNQPMAFYVEMAKTASWAKQCERSADLYFIAQHKAKQLDDIRYLFFSALNALLACNKPKQALELGLQHIDGLSEDSDTYKKLTQVALLANEPAQARDLMLKLIKIRTKQ